MLKLLAKQPCDIVVMHALTVPVDKTIVWENKVNPITEILKLEKRRYQNAQTHMALKTNRLIFDPGIGFGKTPRTSLQLILKSDELTASENRWLYGHSRKSFLSIFSIKSSENRDELTLALSTILAKNGADYLRVHEVATHAKLLDMLCM